MLNQQQSTSDLGYPKNVNDYYIDTLQGMHGVGGDVRDDDSNIISINKVNIAQQNATIPIPANHP